jgi:hypothetical protein
MRSRRARPPAGRVPRGRSLVGLRARAFAHAVRRAPGALPRRGLAHGPGRLGHGGAGRPRRPLDRRLPADRHHRRRRAAAQRRGLRHRPGARGRLLGPDDGHHDALHGRRPAAAPLLAAPRRAGVPAQGVRDLPRVGRAAGAADAARAGGLGIARAAPWSYYPQATVAVLALYALPVAVGSLLALLLMRLAPAGRVKEVATAASVLLAAGLVVGLRALRPEQLAELTPEEFEAFLAGFASLEPRRVAGHVGGGRHLAASPAASRRRCRCSRSSPGARSQGSAASRHGRTRWAGSVRSTGRRARATRDRGPPRGGSVRSPAGAAPAPSWSRTCVCSCAIRRSGRSCWCCWRSPACTS